MANKGMSSKLFRTTGLGTGLSPMEEMLHLKLMVGNKNYARLARIERAKEVAAKELKSR